MTSEPSTLAAAPHSEKAVRSLKRSRAQTLRQDVSLALRVRVMADGSRMFVRFSQTEILEHWILIGATLTLGVSGLAQRFASLAWVSQAINSFLGGFETIRTIHFLAALVFIVLGLYHAVQIAYTWLVKRAHGAMMPKVSDLGNLVGTIAYNLGLAKERPAAGRFSIEEKLGYWAILAIAGALGLTGMVQWFPVFVTQFLPGAVIPAFSAIHSQLGIFGTSAFLLWHLYYTVLKEFNTSIFTGLISEGAMRKNHPLEYARIIAAYDEIQQLKNFVPVETEPAAVVENDRPL